eukprot:9349474-Ditylum_brightwellii.AAC.1
MNKDPVEDTTASQTHDFTAFVIVVANTPNPAVPPPPPPVATTKATQVRTDLNDHPRPENTYMSNRSMPSNYTQCAKQVFHLF